MPLLSQVRACKEASSTLKFVQRPQQQPCRRCLRPHTSTTCSHSRDAAVTTRFVQQLCADRTHQSPRRKPCSVARSLRKTRLRRCSPNDRAAPTTLPLFYVNKCVRAGALLVVLATQAPAKPLDDAAEPGANPSPLTRQLAL